MNNELWVNCIQTLFLSAELKFRYYFLIGSIAMNTKSRRIEIILDIILYVITNGSLMCWTCFFFLGKKVEDLIKVQLSWTKDEERVLIENRLTPKPMYVF